MQIQCNSLVNFFIASCDINNSIFHLKASWIPRFIDKKLKIYAKTTEAPFSLSRAIIHVQIRLGHFQITQKDRKKPRRIRHVCTVLVISACFTIFKHLSVEKIGYKLCSI